MKIKKIYQIADIHFRNFQRHDEFRTICENFIHQVKIGSGDRIVIVGDLVHSRNQLTPELVNEVSWFLKECSNTVEKVIIIPGNHDIVEQNKERMDALTPIISALELNNIVYLKNSQVYVDDNVAWVVYSIYDNNLAPDDILSSNYKNLTKVGLFHGVINGATNEMGFTFAHGSDVDKFVNCDIVLCGDIHKRQVLKTKNGIDVIYVGSMIQQNFGETISGHGYNLIELNGNKISYNFHDIPNPVKYLHFKIRDIEDIETNSEELVNV